MIKYHPCKIGTQPALIQLYRGYRIRVGLIIKYRFEGEHGKWRQGRIWSVRKDGFFHVSHMLNPGKYQLEKERKWKPHET